MKERKVKNRTRSKARSKQGITLIALIITVVIMLILAGVAISAVVSGDGLFDRTRYAAELQNFTQMQEAIQLYYYTVTDGTLPVSRNVSVTELENNQNLKTEIGYYRVFLQTGERPILPQDFSGDFMETPSGIADLYYLDNEKLNANTNKQYIYDTVTGEIYLIEGIKVKGETTYSESGMREIMNENYVPDYVENVTMPPSPEPGTGAGYDFKFINNSGTDTNLYKIYNNGDVYGIGQKGIFLQTSDEEMENLRNDKWQEINFEEVLPGFSKIFNGSQMFRNSQVLLNNEGEIYVSGVNGKDVSNKFGLSQEVLGTYDENKLNKLDFEYGKVKKVFTGDNTTFIITENNKLYATGFNTNGQLGIGNYENTSEFIKVQGIEDVEKIKNIHTYNDFLCVIIEMEDNRFYFAGSNLFNAIGDGKSSSFKTNIFIQIWNEGEFDIDQDIEKLSVLYYGTVILKKDGTLMIATSRPQLDLTDYIDTDKTKFRRLRAEVGSNISDFMVTYNYGIIVKQVVNGEEKYYGYSYDLPNYIGIGEKNFTVDEKKLYEIQIPNELKEEGIKEIGNVYGRYGIIYISNAGNVYYTGESRYSGLEDVSGVITEITKLPINNIECIHDTGVAYGMAYPYLQGKDGKIYTIQNPLLQLNKSLYDYTFKRIVTNVKDISIFSDSNIIAYVDNEKNLFVAGSDRSRLGLGTTDTSEQKEFVKVEDSNIENKVEKVYVGTNIYVLTTDNKLYGTGKTEINGINAPGWEEHEDKIDFVEILSDVEGFHIIHNYKIAYNQEKVWIWYGNTSWGQTYNMPYEIDLSEIDSTLVGNIKDVTNIGLNYLILTKDGRVWSRGKYSGTGVTHSNFQQVSQSNFENKKIVKIVTSGYNRNAFVALAEDGTLYGWGPDSSILGIGNVTTVEQNIPIKLPTNNVKDIVGTASGFIVTKNNGEVWATGNNASGIFGRWISSEAKYAKTVNQNAYEWVRCPSLEK